jgi:hypothetical protein
MALLRQWFPTSMSRQRSGNQARTMSGDHIQATGANGSI